MTTKNYNSTLSTYKVGDLCTFYIQNYNLDRLALAEEKIVKKYSSKISEIINDNTCSENDGKWLSFTRVIGVVIEKYKSNDSRNIDKITVMFKTNDNRYILNKYIVNSHDVFTNNKDNVSPTAVLYIS